MERSEFYPKMRQEASEFIIGGRSASSAFLIWFLENYFRLETVDAIDSVCDQSNDKGIDGIYTDDDDEIIYLFQSKFSPNDDQDQGDVDIRNFIGAREWFQSEETVQNLLNSTASRELKALVQNLNIKDKTNYTKTSVFVTNKAFNTHAKEYIDITSNLESWDIEKLFQSYTYFVDEEIIFPVKELKISNQTKIEYISDGVKVKVYSIPAKELVKLEGIQDRTLFYKNVRYGVGKTRVNKSIKDTIENAGEHNHFFLYHNGITIICDQIIEDPPHYKISLRNYAVINGCQSLLTFFENRTKLSNNLHVLVKIIEITPTSPLVKKITYFANNQNSISLKDLRSNDSVQKSLQREFHELFGNEVQYIRKRGEAQVATNIIIDKDIAAQLISTVYLNSPHNTHLKQRLFGDDYTRIFSRKTKASKIFLSYLIYSIIIENNNLIDNERVREYGLAMFFFTYAIAEILRKDNLGKNILESPSDYVTRHRRVFESAIKKLWELITPDINFDFEEYTQQNGQFLDYKNVFKNSQFIKIMGEKIKSDYTRLIRRNEGDSFENIYNGFAGLAPTTL